MRRLLTVISAALGVVVLVGLLNVAGWARPSLAPLAADFRSAPSALAQFVPEPPGGSVQQVGIVVTGEGSISMKPDVAKVSLGVEVTNASAAGAQQDAAARMDAVMAELKRAGIEEKDIQTVRFDLSPDYDYSTRTPVLKGYRVTNLVVVTVRDIAAVGPLLDSVVASGATRLQGISFSVSDPAQASIQGREEAMKNARTKAEQLARLAGVTLGRPISIEETVSAPPVPMDVRQAAPAAAPPSTPISPGVQEVRTMVRVVYAIQ